MVAADDRRQAFLSSNAQDFIEETTTTTKPANTSSFLSSNAQDFIEDFG